MKIKSLRIKDNYFGWGFDTITFSSNLTLLVGASGVGKTQILEAFACLTSIVEGCSFKDLEWKLVFETNQGVEWVWEGAFVEIVVFERLKAAHATAYLIDRTLEKTYFNATLLPKIASDESVIAVLEEDEHLKNIVAELKSIEFKDVYKELRHKEEHFDRKRLFTYPSATQLKTKYKNLEAIKNSNESIEIKLYACASRKLDVFNKIKQRFIEIFPQVEDIKLEQPHSGNTFVKPEILIKERDVLQWIQEWRISSGMMRTFIHIADLYLTKAGSVILIDEFENSLGVNCMDLLMDDLIHENQHLQFIVTSHHPYIINNVPYEYWKIVTRKGGEIMVQDATAYRLGRSKQDAFIQLTKILTQQL
jgi:predicted ATPase